MMTSQMWMSDVTVFWWMTVKRHSHFLRPGVNHRTPAGSTLKGGGGSEQHILFQHANMDMTWLSYTETQSVHQAASPCSPWTSSPLPLSSHTESEPQDVGVCERGRQHLRTHTNLLLDLSLHLYFIGCCCCFLWATLRLLFDPMSTCDHVSIL